MIALLLGFIEGLTEFLPISSTGHLILAGEVIGFTDNSSVAFKIAIQLGAILAVLLVYWRRFWAVGTGLLKMEKGPVAFTRNILLGFAPALVIGVIAYVAIRAAMQTPEIVAIALIVGGIIGNQSGRGLEGALIGGGLGALGGNAIGNAFLTARQTPWAIVFPASPPARVTAVTPAWAMAVACPRTICGCRPWAMSTN